MKAKVMAKSNAKLPVFTKAQMFECRDPML